jgi:hypothetical protein
MPHVRAISWATAMLLLAGCASAQGAVSAQGTTSARGSASAKDTASADGTVTGRFQLEGGPSGDTAARPIPGTVRFTAAHHRPVTIQVGTSGSFSVRLPAGTYQVAGRTPRIIEVSGGRQHEMWSQTRPVTVTAGHTTRITITDIVP